MAPAPPAYMLPPHPPSRLNDTPKRPSFNTWNGSSDMKRATPAFFAITARSVRSACAFIASTSAFVGGSMFSKKPFISGGFPPFPLHPPPPPLCPPPPPSSPPLLTPSPPHL